MDAAARLAEAGVAPGDELEAQRALLLRVLAWAGDDERIIAVHLKGSLARGEGDRYSDIDLVLDVRPGDWAAIWNDRRAWTAGFGDVIHSLEHQWGPVTDTVCYAVQYRDGVQLDAFIHCGFQPSLSDGVTLWTCADAAAWPTPPTAPPAPAVERDQLEDYLDLYWMGSLLCAKYVLRGDLWMALDFVQTRRSGIITAWRIVHQPDHLDWGWHSAARELPSGVLAQLERAVPGFDAGKMAAALVCATDVMAALGPELARVRGAHYPAEAAGAVRAMIREQLSPLLLRSADR